MLRRTSSLRPAARLRYLAVRGLLAEEEVHEMAHECSHGLAKRANRIDAYPAAIEFLVQHLSTS